MFKTASKQTISKQTISKQSKQTISTQTAQDVSTVSCQTDCYGEFMSPTPPDWFNGASEPTSPVKEDMGLVLDVNNLLK